MMEKLMVYLPPFAPDYSGVCSAFYELGGVSVIHDASGCTSNYTGFDEPRWYEYQQPVFCSGLRELDAIMGDDQKFIGNVAKAVIDLKRPFATLLGSPVPMVIGADMQGIAIELEEIVNVPVIGFDTKGLEYYDKGLEAAYLKIANIFLEDQNQKLGKSVNIIGLSPLDFANNGNATDLIEYYQSNGWQVVSSWTMGQLSSLDNIKLATKASMNIVVSASGLAVAKLLKEKYQIPYIVEVPVGGHANGKKLNNHLGRDKQILIVGDQIIANSMRAALIRDYGFSNIDVASFFTMHEELLANNDFNITSERHYIEELKKRNYSIVIADPLLESLSIVDGNSSLDNNDNYKKTKFIKLPHVAISSRLYWQQAPRFVGVNFNKFIEEELSC